MSDTNRREREFDQARAGALEAVAALPSAPTDLVAMRSTGELLIIGDRNAIAWASRLNDSLRPRLLLTEMGDSGATPSVLVEGCDLELTGHLGNFQLTISGGHAGRAEQTISADLVLDLLPTPLLGHSLSPFGYIHPSSDDPTTVDGTVEQLHELVGEFEKPSYITHNPSTCAHSRAGIEACRRCIDSCPAKAIHSMGEGIVVDHNLCQGGGICASVCPSGSLRYRYPSPEDMLQRLKVLLERYREGGGEEAVVVIVGSADDDPTVELAGNLLPLYVEEVASVGLDFWLSALAYGAKGVLLYQGVSAEGQVSESLAVELATCREIVRSLGYPEEAVAMVDSEGLADYRVGVMPSIEPARFAPLAEKRASVYMAIDHLYGAAQRSRPMALLTADSPFGSADVDANRCTLCMACASACPGGALQSGHDTPLLKFTEANCVHCGICTRTCPEDAIWITPRLIFDREERDRARILYQEEPFLCTVCSKPFATRSVIEKMVQQLSGHWMYKSSRARNRLTMCEQCRVVDVIEDEEAMGEGLG